MSSFLSSLHLFPHFLSLIILSVSLSFARLVLTHSKKSAINPLSTSLTSSVFTGTGSFIESSSLVSPFHVLLYQLNDRRDVSSAHTSSGIERSTSLSSHSLSSISHNCTDRLLTESRWLFRPPEFCGCCCWCLPGERGFSKLWRSPASRRSTNRETKTVILQLSVVYGHFYWMLAIYHGN